MKENVEEFFRMRPGMAKKYEYPGTYGDFVKEIAASLKSQDNQNPLRDIILQKTRRLFGNEVSPERLEDQLTHYPLVSYADHHGLLNYKLLYNSNILYSEIVKALKIPFILVFAAGNVPLDNTSYPRGFYFKNRKFNFFGAKESKTPVFLFENTLRADKKIGIDSFIKSYPKESITPEEKKFLEYLFFECLEIENASENYETFSDQISFLNYKLWELYFDKCIRGSIPKIIYLQSNRIVLDILTKEIKREDSMISLILFNPKIRRIFLNYFNGIAGCWGENSGSQFFWGVVEKEKYKRLIRLQVDDSTNSLAGDNFKISFERDALIEALQEKKILATLFFDYLIITFFSGYLTLGGFNQLDYLQQMQEAHVISLLDYMIEIRDAHIKSLKEIGMHELVDRYSSCVTDGLICGMMPFRYDSGIDLIWEHNSKNGKFNGTLDNGLTQTDLNGMLNMKVKDMILSAVETMLENVSV